MITQVFIDVVNFDGSRCLDCLTYYPKQSNDLENAIRKNTSIIVSTIKNSVKTLLSNTNYRNFSLKLLQNISSNLETRGISSRIFSSKHTPSDYVLIVEINLKTKKLEIKCLHTTDSVVVHSETLPELETIRSAFKEDLRHDILSKIILKEMQELL